MRTNLKRLVGASVVSSAILAVGMVGPASAQATRTPFTGTETVTFTGPPARQWVSGDITHLRGVPIDSTLSGGLDGAFTIEANINVNATGDGSLYGTFTFTSGEVTWTGHFGGTLSGGLVTVHFTGQGSDGSTLVASGVDSSPGISTDTGFIVHPR
jgi:hypothetical protein